MNLQALHDKTGQQCIEVVKQVLHILSPTCDER